jgi:hypothetical protein
MVDTGTRLAPSASIILFDEWMGSGSDGADCVGTRFVSSAGAAFFALMAGRANEQTETRTWKRVRGKG